MAAGICFRVEPCFRMHTKVGHAIHRQSSCIDYLVPKVRKMCLVFVDLYADLFISTQRTTLESVFRHAETSAQDGTPARYGWFNRATAVSR